MNIKILDSWLREFLQTKAEVKQIAKLLSLTSASVERLEKYGSDFLYDIEVTTNRPDLMSAAGLAREASVVLRQNGISANFVPPKFEEPKIIDRTAEILIKNDPKLVNRICAAVMEVKIKKSTAKISERLDATGMRSINNLIDITNYLTRTIGHPSHVFDFDRLATKTLTVRESRSGETIKTLDGKQFKLSGGDIVAENDRGEIVDLLGIMGLENSAVTDNTSRILFFIDNNNAKRIRKTSMSLGIRSEAAVLNEKGIDPELARQAFLYGIKLFEDMAEGKVISDLTDIYPNKLKRKPVTVTEAHINTLIGINIPLKTCADILTGLGFEIEIGIGKLTALPPSSRASDIEIAEDLIEEIARIYGYQNIPNSLPPAEQAAINNMDENGFYWESRVKEAMKYWGFTETYTYSMVPREMIGETEGAIKIKNPLTEEFVFMRGAIVPSLINVIMENQNRENIRIFEIANVYTQNKNKLPTQTLHLAGAVKSVNLNFFNVKGVIEQLAADLGIRGLGFRNSGEKVEIFLDKQALGDIEFHEGQVVSFELNLELIIKSATRKKTYLPISKFPPVFEDLAIQITQNTQTGQLLEVIKKQSPLIKEVTLLDKFENTRTFHIVYQSGKKNLSGEEIGEIRDKILKELGAKFRARLK